MRPCRVAAFLVALSSLAPACTFALADGPIDWFNKGVRYDAQGDPRAAFASYMRAAEGGEPEAEFNVAVMLDSGRGVARDIAKAAIWYARAASHGNRRAAYNLGQLYEAGEGVPRNVNLARAWFASSDLEAAHVRIAGLLRARETGAATELTAPTLLVPEAGARAEGVGDGVELVWTCRPQPEPVRFYVELRALDALGSREVTASFTAVSSLLAGVPNAGGDYAWRVLAVALKASRYVASDWQRFSVAPR